jgi:hypothetical protein
VIWLQAGRTDIPKKLYGIRVCPDWGSVLEHLLHNGSWDSKEDDG